MTANALGATRRRRFAARLRDWYAIHRRDLPWRRDAGDPYRVWISETLLQQTQVTTVIPYYNRFLARFPSVQALAAAPLDDVLKTWEGAGYYARARNLHRAAQEILARFGGQLPSSVPDLLSLPGIGRYTAGAVASIAFGRAAPVLDGNVIRVLCRYFEIRSDVKAAATVRELWDLATALVPPQGAGEYNQALMDLGATICTPHTPDCAACPLKRGCAARRLGIQEQLPARQKKRALPHHQIAVAVIRKGNKLLIAKRFARALLGGLWEFPGGHQEKGESLKQCCRREVREELGIEIAVGTEFAVVEHAYSHLRVTLHAFACEYVRGRPQALGCAAWKWVSARELAQYAFPAANRRIIGMLSHLGLNILAS